VSMEWQSSWCVWVSFVLSPGVGLCGGTCIGVVRHSMSVCGCVVTVMVGSGLGVEVAVIVSFCLVVGTCKLVCIW